MEMPKPGDAHRKLAALVGRWSGRETLHPSPWAQAGGTATATITNQWIVDGFAVAQDYEQRRGGKVTFRGHGVFWVDPSTREYVMHWWDSMGGIGGAYRGGFDGDVLRLGAPGAQGGHSRTSWRMSGPDDHRFLMEVSPDGETWMAVMEGHYRRGKPKTKAAPKKAAKKTPKKAAKKAAKKARRR